MQAPRHSYGTLTLQASASLWCPVAWRFDSVLDAVFSNISAQEPRLAEAVMGARAENGSGVLDMTDWSAHAVMLVLGAIARLRHAEQADPRRLGSLDPIIRALRRDPRIAPTTGEEMLVVDIITARNAGVMHLGLSRAQLPLPELAAEFGLASSATTYHEIDAGSARRLAEFVLHQDLAYNQEVMPASAAADLIDRFLLSFGTDDVHFFTNGTLDEGSGMTSWNPATQSTFDTGILVVGAIRSGCLWVEDED